MDEPTVQDENVEMVQVNIQVTQEEIHRLQIKFASLVLDGTSAERLAVLQQFNSLQAKLKLLKVRRMYSLELDR